MNRIDRLVAILIYLEGRRVTRAEDIADEFATSIRTVYRDIAALAEAGVPIVGEAGVGYSIMRGYHLPPVHFTTEKQPHWSPPGTRRRTVSPTTSLAHPWTRRWQKSERFCRRIVRTTVRVSSGRMSAAKAPQNELDLASLFLIQKALVDRTVVAYFLPGAPAQPRGTPGHRALGTDLLRGQMASHCVVSHPT